MTSEGKSCTNEPPESSGGRRLQLKRIINLGSRNEQGAMMLGVSLLLLLIGSLVVVVCGDDEVVVEKKAGPPEFTFSPYTTPSHTHSGP